MSYRQLIEAQQRRSERPTNPEKLLLYPIANDPMAPTAVMDPAWIEEHAKELRFHVAGLSWLQNLTGLNADRIVKHRDAATRLAQKIGWSTSAGAPLHVARQLQRFWQEVARQQYFSITKQRPVAFPKAAVFLLTCELALQEIVDDPSIIGADTTQLTGVSSGADVYKHMAIVPACWNVNDFTEIYLEEHSKRNGFMQSLATAAQQAREVITELAQGHTVTYRTAKLVKDHCESIGEPVGDIRCRAGKSQLGTRSAANEELAP